VKKNIQKSIRISQDIYDVLDKFSGSSFNQKLENFVYRMTKSEPEIEKRIKILEKREQELLRNIDRLRSIETNLNTVKRYMTEVAKMCNNVPLLGQQKLEEVS